MPREKVGLGRFAIAVPRTQNMRIALGSALMLMGMVGFLPIVGFWMIPVGLMILAIDLPLARLWRMRLTRYWRRWRENR